MLAPLGGSPQGNSDREHEVVMPAGASLVSRSARSRDVATKVLQLLTQGMRLAQLGGEAQLAPRR